jgi:hypothetical protein
MWQRILTIGLMALAFLFVSTMRPSIARGEDEAVMDPNKAAFIGTWRLAMTPTDVTASDGAQSFNESIYFEEDDIMAEAFAQYGFVSDGYWTFAEGPAFYGMMSSNSKGTLYWQGVAVGNALSGFVVWVKSDGSVWTFTFTGTKAN